MPKDMADAIVKLVESPELRERLGTAARERIRTVFNWDAKGEFIENLLNELDKNCSKSN